MEFAGHIFIIRKFLSYNGKTNYIIEVTHITVSLGDYHSKITNLFLMTPNIS